MPRFRRQRIGGRERGGGDGRLRAAVVATLLMLWRSVDAFGGGDIKLLSAIGAWLGLEGVIYTILLSCLVFGLYSAVRRQRAGAFGPSLSVSAVIILLWLF